MHELSFALSIVDLAAEAAERQGGPRVVAIYLRLGPRAGVVPDALRSAYDLARESSAVGAAERS
jgi:hydrogenase nickel incorporation protein HypA/HybF